MGETERVDLAMQIDRVLQVLAQKRDNIRKLLVWNFEANVPFGIPYVEIDQITKPWLFRWSGRKRPCPIGP
jgi:hypothetical protein